MVKTSTVNGWVQTADRKVIRGDQVLNIGDIVHYHDKAGENGTEKYTGTWKVLGAENGELLIMSDSDVDTKIFNENKTLEGGKEAYTNGINELNKICKVYGTGTGATGARSITVEDVDRVTGYDKTTYEYKPGIFKLKYGENITYYWDTVAAYLKKPYYETGRGLTGCLTNRHLKFVYYDGKTWQESVLPTILPTKRQKICMLTQTYYYYDVDRKTTLTKTNADGATNEAYKMLFGNSNENYYWLASSYVDANSRDAYFGLHFVIGGNVSGYDFVDSYGGYSGGDGVRAVVTLSSNVSL